MYVYIHTYIHTDRQTDRLTDRQTDTCMYGVSYEIYTGSVVNRIHRDPDWNREGLQGGGSAT